MNWQKLKSMKCPQCSAQMARNLMYKHYGCTKCSFVIGDVKFNEIIANLYKPKRQYKSAEDNLSELNNLGHDKITEDFSDSKFI